MKDRRKPVKAKAASLPAKRREDSLARELYRGMTGRDASAAELASCHHVMQRGDGVAALVETLFDTPACRAKALSAVAPELVEAAYKGVLGRASDAQGFQSCLVMLRQRNDLAALLRIMVQCNEFKVKYLAAANAPEVLKANDAAPTAARARKGRLIVVSGNCQTAGLAAALQDCLPADTISPLPLPLTPDPETSLRFTKKVAEADVWVTSGHLHLWKHILESKTNPAIQFVLAPAIRFPAFHPDLCYVRKYSDGELTALRYNSAIAAWCFNKGVDPRDARKLFHRGTYAALGYFHLWNPSVAALRGDFEASKLDFGRLFLALQRRGVFMYSLDHPKVGALVELARLVARKLGAPESVFDRAVDIPDGLTGNNWAVYPEIADELSLPRGSYEWKEKGAWVQGLDDYLTYAYGEYSRQQIPKGGLRLEKRDESLYDRVLGPQVGIG